METLEQKVDRLEHELAAAKKKSPTGKAKIPASWVMPLNALVVAAGGAVTYLGNSLGAAHPATIGAGLVAAVALVLLANSPGYRKLAMVLVCLVPLSLTGCAHGQLTPAGRAAIDCTLGPAVHQVPGLLDHLDSVTSVEEADWKQVGLTAVSRWGIEAVLCGLEQLGKVVADRIALTEGLGGSFVPDSAGPGHVSYRVQRARIEGLIAGLTAGF